MFRCPLKIHCTEEFKILLDKLEGYQLQERGFINIRGKGMLKTFWLIGEDQQRQLRRCQINELSNKNNKDKSPFNSILFPSIHHNLKNGLEFGKELKSFEIKSSPRLRSQSIDTEKVKQFKNLLPIYYQKAKKLNTSHLNLSEQNHFIRQTSKSQTTTPITTPTALTPTILTPNQRSTFQSSKSQNQLNQFLSPPFERRSVDPLERRSVDPLERRSADLFERRSADPFERRSTDLRYLTSKEINFYSENDPPSYGSVQSQSNIHSIKYNFKQILINEQLHLKRTGSLPPNINKGKINDKTSPSLQCLTTFKCNRI